MWFGHWTMLGFLSPKWLSLYLIFCTVIVVAFKNQRKFITSGRKISDLPRARLSLAQAVGETLPLRVNVAIIGAGVSGLACAKELFASGENDFVVLESTSSPGGRIKTDVVDGFLLDRGFQVFIDSYPQAQEFFDYSSLDLQPFLPGAVVRYDNGFHVVSDPFRRPQDILKSLVSPIGSLQDKIKELSAAMIDRFFKPFYQGIFLSKLESQSSKMFEFVFKMFTEGSATLPRRGMGSISEQLASALPPNALRYDTKIMSLQRQQQSGGFFELAAVTNTPAGTGKTPLKVLAKKVVIATDAPNAASIMGGSAPAVTAVDARSSTCLYYALDGAPPETAPVLVLNGENDLSGSTGEGSTTVNNVCFPSQVSPDYAPSGKSLASVTVVGAAKGVSDQQLDASVRSQLARWWGVDTIASWKLLKIYRIPFAQPSQAALPYPGLDNSMSSEARSRLGPALYMCGDHIGSATLNGAIESGRGAARALISDSK